MGNPNPVQSEEFKEKRKETQFGGIKGNPLCQDIPDAVHPWSYRKNLRYLSAQPINPDNVHKELEKLTIMPDGSQPSVARVLSIRFMQKVYAKMRGDDMIKLIEEVEGKQVQPTQELAPPAPMLEQYATEEEAAAAHAAAAGL